MAITYTWEIKEIKVVPSYEGLSNIVRDVTYKYKGTDENNNSAFVETTQTFSTADAANFTPYEDLTEQAVINWIKSYINVDKLSELIAYEISEQSWPEAQPKPLPW